MKKSYSSILKLVISLGLGFLIIFLVANNFKKPQKIKLTKSQIPKESEWKFTEWNQNDSYIEVGDTLAYMSNTTGETLPIISTYEGEIHSKELSAGEEIISGTVIAKVKVDIIYIVKDTFKRSNKWWLVLSVLLSLISHYSRAIRWKMLYKPLGYTPSTGNAFGAILVMYLSNLAFPRLGEVLRCTILNRFEKIPMSTSVGTMITERAIDMVCLIVLMGACFIFQNQIFIDFYNEYMPESNNTSKIIILGVGAIGAAALFFLYKSGKLPFAEKIQGMVKSLWDGVASIRNIEKPWLFVGHTIFIWLMYIAMTGVCFYALPETSNITILAALPTLFFGAIAMVAVQGGLGLYPYFVSKILVMYGIAETIGYAFGWVLWSAQTLLVILAGLVAYALLIVFNRDKSAEATETTS